MGLFEIYKCDVTQTPKKVVMAVEPNDVAAMQTLYWNVINYQHSYHPPATLICNVNLTQTKRDKIWLQRGDIQTSRQHTQCNVTQPTISTSM